MKKKFLNYNLIQFIVIFVVAFAVSLLESYKYAGFFNKHFNIPSTVIYLLSLISFLGLLFSKDSLENARKNKFYQYFLKSGVIVFLIILLINLILNYFENFYFKNWSYATLHVQTQNLIFPLLLLSEIVYLFLIDHHNFVGSRLWMNLVSYRKYKFWENFVSLLILATLLLLFVGIIKGPDSLSKRVFINSDVIFSLSLTILLFFKYKNTKLLSAILKANSILMVPFWIIYLILTYLELKNYNNFILSKYHIHLDGLISLPLFSFLLWLFVKIQPYFPKIIFPGRNFGK